MVLGYLSERPKLGCWFHQNQQLGWLPIFSVRFESAGLDFMTNFRHVESFQSLQMKYSLFVEVRDWI